MKVPLGLLADYANVTDSGKLNIMGVFQVINAPQFPHLHPQLHLVLQLEADRTEGGGKRKLEIKLTNEDGLTVLGVGGQMEVPKAAGDARITTGPIIQNHILGFQNLVFEKPGNYEFKVLVDEDFKFSVPLKVFELKQRA